MFLLYVFFMGMNLVLEINFPNFPNEPQNHKTDFRGFNSRKMLSFLNEFFSGLQRRWVNISILLFRDVPGPARSAQRFKRCPKICFIRNNSSLTSQNPPQANISGCLQTFETFRNYFNTARPNSYAFNTQKSHF